jgi:hypothetical protein
MEDPRPVGFEDEPDAVEAHQGVQGMQNAVARVHAGGGASTEAHPLTDPGDRDVKGRRDGERGLHEPEQGEDAAQAGRAAEVDLVAGEDPFPGQDRGLGHKPDGAPGEECALPLIGVPAEDISADLPAGGRDPFRYPFESLERGRAGDGHG